MFAHSQIVVLLAASIGCLVIPSRRLALGGEGVNPVPTLPAGISLVVLPLNAKDADIPLMAGKGMKFLSSKTKDSVADTALLVAAKIASLAAKVDFPVGQDFLNRVCSLFSKEYVRSANFIQWQPLEGDGHALNDGSLLPNEVMVMLTDPNKNMVQITMKKVWENPLSPATELVFLVLERKDGPKTQRVRFEVTAAEIQEVVTHMTGQPYAEWRAVQLARHLRSNHPSQRQFRVLLPTNDIEDQKANQAYFKYERSLNSPTFETFDEVNQLRINRFTDALHSTFGFEMEDSQERTVTFTFWRMGAKLEEQIDLVDPTRKVPVSRLTFGVEQSSAEPFLVTEKRLAKLVADITGRDVPEHLVAPFVRKLKEGGELVWAEEDAQIVVPGWPKRRQ